MRRQADLFRWKLLRLVLFLFLLQPLACGERKEPIGIITTTNYCQGTTTASDSKVKPGDIALSHDIEKKHKLKFGDLIYLEGEKEPYVFTDRMPGQWTETRGSLQQELQNGRRIRGQETYAMVCQKKIGAGLLV